MDAVVPSIEPRMQYPRPAGRGQGRALTVRKLGRTEFAATLDAMRHFTEARDAATTDEIWLTEHAPVYTLGLAGRPEHVLDPGGIPLVHADRGGQVTYHGPGQVVAYLLLDLARRGLKVRELVRLIEEAVIATLSAAGIDACRRAGMPGVYVKDAKISALGLKVRKGCSYHGVSLNVDMDLAPFAGIDPCGYRGLAVTQVREFAPATTPSLAAMLLAGQLQRVLRAPHRDAG